MDDTEVGDRVSNFLFLPVFSMIFYTYGFEDSFKTLITAYLLV